MTINPMSTNIWELELSELSMKLGQRIKHKMKK